MRYEPQVSRRLCHCMGVSERDVLRAIRRGAKTVDDVGRRCEAGSGCGSCRGGIVVLLAQEQLRQLHRGDILEALDQLGLFDDSNG